MPDGMSPQALIERMEDARVEQQRALVRELDAIAEFDERRLWRVDGATSMTAWIAATSGREWGEAREMVRVARVLQRLPEMRAALAEGVLSYEQVRPLTRFADERTEAEWIARGREMSPKRLWLEVRRRERMSPEDEQEAHGRRYVWCGWSEDGLELRFEGQVGAEQGAALVRALEEAAQRLPADGEAQDPRGARLADALVGLATSEEPGRCGTPTIVVHADAEVLTGEDERANGEPPLSETDDGVRLGPETVRRMACDAGVEWVLESEGHPVGVGRRRRTIPGWLGRLVWFRDRGCRFHGCGRRLWVHAHHIRHWADGGRTDLDNLVLLCSSHHRLVHEDGWSVRGNPSGGLVFDRPGDHGRTSLVA